MSKEEINEIASDMDRLVTEMGSIELAALIMLAVGELAMRVKALEAEKFPSERTQ